MNEEVRVQAMFDSIGTGAIAIDKNGKIEAINDRALELLGFKRSELKGKWFPQVLKAYDENKNIIEPIDRPITKSFLTGKPVNTKAYYQKQDKTLVPVSINVSPIMLKDQPVGAIEVFEDVSLELEVDRMKSEFISIASHQLRTPLSAISVYSQMLLDGYQGNINSQQRESLETIMKSTQRMNKLISALLDISKIETGKINVKYSSIELDRILKGVIKDLEQDAVRKSIDLKINIQKSDFNVNSDALLVGEVYSNLISNAIKYTPQNGKVKVSLKSNKNNYSLCVKDTGYGIPVEFSDKIFTKFSRAPNIQSVDTTGSGLGLYMAKEISNILQGKLWFKSEEQKGTSFFFSLPKTI